MRVIDVVDVSQMTTKEFRKELDTLRAEQRAHHALAEVDPAYAYSLVTPPVLDTYLADPGGLLSGSGGGWPT